MEQYKKAGEELSTRMHNIQSIDSEIYKTLKGSVNRDRELLDRASSALARGDRREDVARILQQIIGWSVSFVNIKLYIINLDLIDSTLPKWLANTMSLVISLFLRLSFQLIISFLLFFPASMWNPWCILLSHLEEDASFLIFIEVLEQSIDEHFCSFI